jgi:NAD(P)-dependent dehydrogenase (short-subunit alcohol dehydrogenase family)
MIDPQLESKVVLITGANISYLASEQARWLAGQLLYVGGGWRLPQ